MGRTPVTLDDVAEHLIQEERCREEALIADFVRCGGYPRPRPPLCLMSVSMRGEQPECPGCDEFVAEVDAQVRVDGDTWHEPCRRLALRGGGHVEEAYMRAMECR